MTWELVVVIAVVVGAIGLVAWSASSTSAKLLHTVTEGRTREVQFIGLLIEKAKQDTDLCLRVMDQSYKRQQELAEQSYVANLLQKQGQGFIVQKPDEYMERFITSIMEQADLTREAAIKWLVASVREPEGTPG